MVIVSAAEKADTSAESPAYLILSAQDMNKGAASATLSNIGNYKALWIGDKWREVTCSDGTKARVLKDPADAFELYAKEWTGKFGIVLDAVNNMKISADAEAKSKIVMLFDNLNYVNAALQEMYKNTYLTFAATPCSESAQAEKRRMDRIISAIGLSLVSVKLILDNADGHNIDKVNEQVLKLVDRIISMLDSNNAQ